MTNENHHGAEEMAKTLASKPASKPRTPDDIRADMKALLEKCRPIMDGMGDAGSGPLELAAVLDARPDLKARYDRLVAEAMACQMDWNQP